MLFQPSDIISTYSRKQALEDGFQVCVSKLFPNDTRMYKYPVFFEDELPCYRLLAQCSPLDFDNPKPAITIMFPDER